MKTFLMLAGAAAMAVSMPALAKPDKGQGGGNGGGAKAERQGGGNAQKANRGGGQRAERGQARQVKSVQRQTKGRSESFAREDRKAAQRSVRAEQRRIDRVRDVRVDRVRGVDRFDDDGFRNDLTLRRADFVRSEGFCPPGLAKKGNGCLPPGQAKKIFARGEMLNRNWFDSYNVPLGYRDLYYDNDDYYYRYDDNGYIYRVNRDNDLVSGLIPLLGGGFGVGQMLPAGYDVYNVPLQYRNTYYDTDEHYYRYGDNAIYRVDPRNGTIDSVAALLTGNNFALGQPMPVGYDMYNVPYAYRDQYYDTPQYNYRYADGNIYQVDPQTQIIEAIISALI